MSSVLINEIKFCYFFQTIKNYNFQFIFTVRTKFMNFDHLKKNNYKNQ